MSQGEEKGRAGGMMSLIVTHAFPQSRGAGYTPRHVSEQGWVVLHRRFRRPTVKRPGTSLPWGHFGMPYLHVVFKVKHIAFDNFLRKLVNEFIITWTLLEGSMIIMCLYTFSL